MVLSNLLALFIRSCSYLKRALWNKIMIYLQLPNLIKKTAQFFNQFRQLSLVIRSGSHLSRELWNINKITLGSSKLIKHCTIFLWTLLAWFIRSCSHLSRALWNINMIYSGLPQMIKTFPVVSFDSACFGHTIMFLFDKTFMKHLYDLFRTA